jgi:hypothetical protein
MEREDRSFWCNGATGNQVTEETVSWSFRGRELAPDGSE